MIDARTLEELVAAFSETTYKDDISAAMIDAPDHSGIEKGLKNNLSRSFSKIARFASGEVKPLVRVLLGRFDLWNIKSVLRGKHVGAELLEIMEAVLPAGELSDPLLYRLAEQHDVKGVVNLLSTWLSPFAATLRESIPTYYSSGNLLDLELPMDVYFYKSSFNELKSLGDDINVLLLKEFFQQEIDYLNILSAMRLSREKTSEEAAMKYFVPGGKSFSQDEFRRLVNIGEPEGALEILTGTRYQEAVEDGLRRFAKSGLVSAFQRALEEFMVRKANKLFLVDPLTIGIIIAYIWTKYNEVVNLRIIVRGKSVGMDESLIREELIIV